MENFEVQSFCVCVNRIIEFCLDYDMEIVERNERSVVETQAEARGLRVACKN